MVRNFFMVNCPENSLFLLASGQNCYFQNLMKPDEIMKPIAFY